jgi:hypothetical protein
MAEAEHKEPTFNGYPVVENDSTARHEVPVEHSNTSRGFVSTLLDGVKSEVSEQALTKAVSLIEDPLSRKIEEEVKVLKGQLMGRVKEEIQELLSVDSVTKHLTSFLG